MGLTISMLADLTVPTPSPSTLLCALTRSTVLIAVSSLALTLAAGPGWADGGAGGVGGAGGTDSLTSAGGAGGDSNSGHGGGGGGGGAGLTTGGAGGSSAFGGVGGRGGTHGYLGPGLTSSSWGVQGGQGQASPWAYGGGGGGAGGTAAIVTGSGTWTQSNTGTLKGGDGGAGGSATNGYGGAGGSGGVGLYFTSTGAKTISIGSSAEVTGGNGGIGGLGGTANGSHGVGGAAIIGSNLSIILGSNSNVSGGLNGSGTVRANAITFTGGANALTLNSSTTLRGDIEVAGSLVLDSPTDVTLSNVIKGSASVSKIGTSVLTLTGANTYTGGTTVEAGTLRWSGSAAPVQSTAYTVNGGTLDLGSHDLTASSLSGTGGTIALSNYGRLTVDQSTNTSYAGVISGTGDLVKTGSGTLMLSGTNTYSGGTGVYGGRLEVNGSLANAVIVSGGELGGTGSVGQTIISGGTLAPGNPMGTFNVNGVLRLGLRSTYAVEVSSSDASRVNVSSSAHLDGGKVSARFAPGTYVSKQYTILQSSGGIYGQFVSETDTNLPAGFKAALSYGSRNVYLDLTLAMAPPPGTSFTSNQSGVANAVTSYFDSNGSIPLELGGLTPAGLTHAAGEPATGTQTATNGAMTQFMGTLVDASPEGRGVSIAPAPGSFASYAAYGSGKAASSKDVDLPTRKLALTADPDAWRWSVWGSGFGGAQFTGADASAGTAANTNRVYGAAVGADYKLTPSTIAGFALAGGATSFNTYGLGSGKSDLFQAGLFLRQHFGQGYLSAALAYGWQDVTTDRSVGGDRLEAKFDVNSWSGRLETGHRFALGPTALTPYAAAQFTMIALPNYAETAPAGTSLFALSYASRDVTSTRSELGLRADASFSLVGLPLALRGALAWVHNFDTATTAIASFQSLPGATFLVSGAALDRNALRTSATAELDLRNGLSIAATFDSEFGENSRSLGGKGAIRYRW